MRKFLLMLLAVLFCTSAMCICDVYADSATSVNAQTTKKETIQNSLSNANSIAINNGNAAYSDEEVYLTAQLIHHEAHNQAYNGKVAVAEVILNRVNSTLFPNSIESVVFQSGQFTNVRRLKNVNPSDQELRIAYNVLNGDLRTLNDQDILYFRNPKVTSGIAASVDKNWGGLDYETHIGDHAFYSQEAPAAIVKKEQGGTKEKKTSFFDKLPVSISLAKFFTPKKAKEKVSNTAQTSEVIEDNTDNNTIIVEIADSIKATVEATEAEDSVDVESMTAEERQAYEEAKQLEEAMSAEFYAKLAEQNGIVLDTIDDDNADDDSESQEIVNVDNMIFMAQAQALALEIKRNGKKEEAQEEEYDENDPVAVARHQAYLNEKAELERRAKMAEEERKANENAQKQAVMLDQMAVEIAARETAEMARATQAAVDQVKAMQGK